MKNLIKNSKGFTLIELVMVIVILGILAAVAIPKFVDLKVNAQQSVAQGALGAVQGAIVMLHARYLVGGSDYTVTDVIGSVETSGLDGIDTTSVDIGGVTYGWTMARNSGNTSATVVTNTNGATWP